MLGKEAQVLINHLSQLMADKLEEKYSHVHMLINRQISIAVAQLYSLILRNTCLPIHLWERKPNWELGFGMGLEQ